MADISSYSDTQTPSCDKIAWLSNNLHFIAAAAACCLLNLCIVETHCHTWGNISKNLGVVLEISSKEKFKVWQVKCLLTPHHSLLNIFVVFWETV